VPVNNVTAVILLTDDKKTVHILAYTMDIYILQTLMLQLCTFILHFRFFTFYIYFTLYIYRSSIYTRIVITVFWKFALLRCVPFACLCNCINMCCKYLQHHGTNFCNTV